METSEPATYREVKNSSTATPRSAQDSVTMGAMLLTLLTLFGCAPPPYEAPVVDTGEVEDTSPSIRITYPSPEQQVTGCAMIVADIQNLQLVDFMAEPEVREGAGHWHVIVDSDYITCTKPYCLFGFDPEVTGTVSLTARLTQNNHDPLLDENDDFIEAEILLNVIPGECTEGTPGEY